MTKGITRFAMRIGIFFAIVVAGYLGAISIGTFKANAVEDDTCESDKCELQTVRTGYIVQFAYQCVDDPPSETGCDSRYSWLRARLECDTYECD